MLKKIHKKYTALDKSLHKTRHDQIKEMHMSFSFHLIHLNLMNTLHINTENFPVTFCQYH